MSLLREWLPITKGNRVALGLASAALLAFVAWNFMPYYEYEATKSHERMFMVVWPAIFSPSNYVDTFKSPSFDGVIAVIVCLSLLFNGIITLTCVPFWIILHASTFVRLPLAVMSLLGGCAAFWVLSEVGLSGQSDFSLAGTILLMALAMFASSAALFVFQNELALRKARSVGR